MAVRYSTVYNELRQSLDDLYGASEATAIAKEVMLAITGKTYSEDRVYGFEITDVDDALIKEKTVDLLRGRPMQYVLGEAWFKQQKYLVNEHVLIPRPETEELVQWILEDWANGSPDISLLDVGTGSGCIPISLKLAMPKATITSCDISQGALSVAAENAFLLKASVHFIALDFLSLTSQARLGKYDVIVSNPPYIPESEQQSMHRNVVDHEPASALFVPDNDPQLFYRAIARFGLAHLKDDGAIYCELHQDFGQATQAVFEEMGYKKVLIQKDLNGNMRMLKATKTL